MEIRLICTYLSFGNFWITSLALHIMGVGCRPIMQAFEDRCRKIRRTGESSLNMSLRPSWTTWHPVSSGVSNGVSVREQWDSSASKSTCYPTWQSKFNSTVPFWNWKGTPCVTLSDCLLSSSLWWWRESFTVSGSLELQLCKFNWQQSQ